MLSSLSGWLSAESCRCSKTNEIQREFDSNGGIAPFDHLLASSYPRQKTNLFKPCLPSLAKRIGESRCHFAPPKEACCQSCYEYTLIALICSLLAVVGVQLSIILIGVLNGVVWIVKQIY
jgi:hypothetical protein